MRLNHSSLLLRYIDRLFSTAQAQFAAVSFIAIALLLTAVGRVSANDDDDVPVPAEFVAACCDACERQGDEIWLIDDRHSGCLEEGADVAASLRFKRYNQGGDDWQDAKADDFFNGPGADRPTCFWVHGDRVDSGSAISAGLTVYRRLVRKQEDAPPLRFVIWSWPTTQVYRRPVPDVRLKASRTPATGFRLGYVLSRGKGDAPVGLIAYSFGSRVVTGALTVVSGGELQGHSLEKPAPPVAKYRAALMASATDYDWLEPGEPHGMALKSVDKMLLINNSCDRVLAHYRVLACSRHGAPALGYCGVASLSALGADAAKIRQYDACCEVGKYHRWWLYICSDSIMGQIRATVLPK